MYFPHLLSLSSATVTQISPGSAKSALIIRIQGHLNPSQSTISWRKGVKKGDWFLGKRKNGIASSLWHPK